MTMIPTPCPNCHAPEMPEPPRRGRNVYVRCPACNANCRAAFADTIDGNVVVRYSIRRDHRRTVVKRVKTELARIMDTKQFRDLMLDRFGIVV